MQKKLKTVEEIYNQINSLKKDLKDAKIQEKKDERVWEKHAKIVLGGMVIKCFEGSDWKKVDIREFDRYLSRWHNKIKEQCTVEEKRNARTANEAVKEFEKWSREQKKQAQEAKNELAGTDE